jgi:site-specific recombinase XerD
VIPAKAGDPLLVGARGRRLLRTTLSEMFTRIGRRAGIGRIAARTHQFRHVLNLVARTKAGLDVQQRAALLNHVSTATLQVYDHEQIAEAREARDATWGAVKKLTGCAAANIVRAHHRGAGAARCQDRSI